MGRSDALPGFFRISRTNLRKTVWSDGSRSSVSIPIARSMQSRSVCEKELELKLVTTMSASAGASSSGTAASQEPRRNAFRSWIDSISG